MTKDTKNEIVVYQPDELVRLDVCLANDTVWLSILQMSVLFGRERSVIAKHLKAAIDEGELDAAINVQNLHNNQKGRPQAFYDLDAIISVGYRVKSLRGTQFRRWATRILRDRLLIIDDKTIYLIGASLKDLGKKCFAFTRLDADVIQSIKARLEP